MVSLEARPETTGPGEDPQGLVVMVSLEVRPLKNLVMMSLESRPETI
jgi:hypothetical protein